MIVDYNNWVKRKRIWAIVALMALPLALRVGVKAANDTRDERAIEIAVRGKDNKGQFPNAVRSKLDVRLVPLQTTIKPQLARGANGPYHTLILPIQLENHSDETIKAGLSHEWYGGIPPLTDLYAFLPTGKNRAFAPVYLVGETGAAEPAILKPGASKRLDLRMNWPGTGSCPALPIMDADHNGDYSLRFVLMLGDAKNRSYVLGQKMKIRVEADEN